MKDLNIIHVDSMNWPELAPYNGMSEPQLRTMYEPQVGAFIAETQLVIERALESGYEPISFLIEDTYLEKLTGHDDKEDNISQITDDVKTSERFDTAGIFLTYYSGQPIYVASHDVLCTITGYELTRGMLALMRRKPDESPEQVLRLAKKIVVLENVMNPTNLGAIIRTAAALNVDALVLTPGSTDPLYRRAIRVSMGNVFLLPWCYAGIDELERLGFKTVAMALRKNSTDISNPALKECDKLAIIMGTEGEGLKDETIDGCDFVVKIPMREGVDSLNVSAAAAIAMWELFE